MLATQVSFAPDSTMVIVQVSNPKWAAEPA